MILQIFLPIAFILSFIPCGKGHNERGLLPPVIDVNDLLNYFNSAVDTERSPTNSALGKINDAMRQWGFFYVINHGISEHLINDLEQQAKLFFDSPQEVKDSIRRQLNNSRGYADIEYTKQKVDAKQVFDMGHKPFPDLPDDDPQNIILDGYNQWPESDENLKDFRRTITSYYDACTTLSHLLFKSIAYFLPSHEAFEDGFLNHTSHFRLNIYPVEYTLSSGEGFIDTNQLGISRHTDAGILTILWQDSAGLEVYTGTKEHNNDGKWILVEPIPGALTINIGDMFQVLSNSVFKAAEHRVRKSKTSPRYSAAYFYNPNYDFVVSPLVESDAIARYRPIEWGHFRHQRFLGDYADFGKEIQIEDFEISLS